MLFERQYGTRINWPGGKPRDSVAIPDHAISLLTEAGLTARVGHNVYEIVNGRGDALQLPFGCTHQDWQDAIAQLKSAA